MHEKPGETSAWVSNWILGPLQHSLRHEMRVQTRLWQAEAHLQHKRYARAVWKVSRKSDAYAVWRNHAEHPCGCSTWWERRMVEWRNHVAPVLVCVVGRHGSCF